MEITPELAGRMAELSRLELSPEEAREMAAELGRVLEYMDVLGRLDGTDAEPPCRMSPQGNVLREDCPAPSLDRAELLGAAPASDGGTYLVPRTVE